MLTRGDILRIQAESFLASQNYRHYSVEYSPDLDRAHLLGPATKRSLGYVETKNSRYVTGMITLEDDKHLPAMECLADFVAGRFTRTFCRGRFITRRNPRT